MVKAWDVIPDQTSVYQIGGVPYEWLSGWLDMEVNEHDTVLDFVLVHQHLDRAADMAVQFYYDHSVNPEDWAIDQAKDGVTTVAGQSEVRFDLTAREVLPGWRVFRVAEHGERYSYSMRFVQLRMTGVANAEAVRLYQVSLRGLEQDWM